MKVFLLGATGNVGSRLIPALLTHHHSVVAMVRTSSKLEALLPQSVFEQITVVQGNATDSNALKQAILDSGCDAVVTAAGVAAVAPWSSGELPKIFGRYDKGGGEASIERQGPLRAWFLGGTGVLNFPGTQSMLSNYMPIYLEHRRNLQLLRELPPNTVDWSMLCPMTMVPESTDLSAPTKSSSAKLVANSGSPPLWRQSWVQHIPLIGRTLSVMMNAGRYETTLEQNAELIASDLETRDSRFIGHPVGVIDPAK